MVADSIYQNKHLLKRFIRQVGKHSDTPSLIMTIAADAGYLILCRTIVDSDPATESHQKFLSSLIKVCYQNGLDWHQLKRRLTPAARALGLKLSYDAQIDYYRLLGVDPQADAQEIKKAFRRQVLKVHPDTSAVLTGDSQMFIDLNDAYQTLCSPVLRRHYDLSRQNLSQWREIPRTSLASNNTPKRFLWSFLSLLIMLILLMFLFDLLLFPDNILPGAELSGMFDLYAM